MMNPERWQQIKQLVQSAIAEDAATRSTFLQQSCANDLPMRLGAEALLSWQDDGHEDATRKFSDNQAPLSPQRWQQVERLFQSALELDAAERAAYLDQACDHDDALRHEVESLLVYQAAAGGLIEGAIQEATGLLPNSSEAKARFTPGTTLNKRYRIIGLLGRGGMGEVYRADDLKLGQPVALKFLTEKMSQDKAMLARFHTEVSMAHRVTHPNVCRVHDIGDVTTSSGNLHFLSMEYVDGEDLSSLLRRIGRLPADKAVEIANQLCAGLAAAHEAGVLHRDLKPANVMIDGKGRVRITDFGLAGFAEQIKGSEVMAGTPAYMSPEQFAGKEVTTKSDIYALGLVLYEIFTGKRVFEAGSLAELQRMHESSSPTNPSNWVKDIDPLVERVILRCLEKDPSKRLASAKQVSDALPGGDPLVAALALGETPSPEMVAAAGSKEGMKPMYAVACLVAILACLITIPFLIPKISLFHRMPADQSPEMLAKKSREITAQLGWTERPTDIAYGIIGAIYSNNPEMQHLQETAKSSSDWDNLISKQRLPYGFWYRESPQYLIPHSLSEVERDDPPRTLGGMTYLKLNSSGSLRYFEAMPNAIDNASTQANEIDWKMAFAAAGLDFNNFKPTEQVDAPRAPYDSRAAWSGPHPLQPEVSLHIEAATYRGRFVYFHCSETKMVELLKEKQKQFTASNLTTKQTIAATIMAIILLAMLLGAVLLAKRNWRLQRGDRAGALRLAGFVFFGSIVASINAGHVPLPQEIAFIYRALADALFLSAFSWVIYLSLEPFARRRWPETLIGLQLVLQGKWREPVVGRDILIGLLAGLGSIIISCLSTISSFKYGGSPATVTLMTQIISTTYTVSFIARLLSSSVYYAAGTFFLVFMACVLFRRDWLGLGVLILLGVGVFLPGAGYFGVSAIAYTLLLSSVPILVAWRYGLLASVALSFSEIAWMMSSNLSAWYASNTILVFALLLGLAIYAFHTSLGGQKVFAGKLLEE